MMKLKINRNRNNVAHNLRDKIDVDKDPNAKRYVEMLSHLPHTMERIGGGQPKMKKSNQDPLPENL